jgi:hypothetical protein
MVDVCGLCDIDYYGRSWTFEKKVAGGTFCQVRLDRALATTDWSARFPLLGCVTCPQWLQIMALLY